MDMSAYEDVIGDVIEVADIAVVPHMDSDHNEVIVANMGGSFFDGAPVDGHIISDAVVVADDNLAWSRDVKRCVLRMVANDGTAADLIVFAHLSAAGNPCSGADPAACSNACSCINDGKRSDGDVVSELGVIAYDGRGVDQWHAWDFIGSGENYQGKR